ncbi:hypothetical protein P22_2071 [Propionispora sp. 2/2-37]|uniref:C-terminal binding protein n=1 Tax=Propionispora sp. 2/2-37 TaxID=1677858 RepID=UPI0006BB6381|nr:C-terminal binding protein [Propionispora sp. 2/2-37]CUH95983.1 hypothetical protein P22_2071 [Propionispora sp. 2/2-37]
MRPLIWIIDEEWPDYEIEKEILTRKFPGCTIRFSGEQFAADLADFGKLADAIICQINIEMSADIIEQLEQCKVIAVYGAGYDKVDVKSAKSKGIPVSNVPGYCNEDLSDYVIASIYHFNKQLTSWQLPVKEGRWGAQAVKNPVKRVSKSTLFIIGFGKIGRMTATKAKALGMRVLAYSPHLTTETAEIYGVEKVDWDTGLAQADYVSVHTIFTEATASLLSYTDFSKMKPTAYFINTSRGGVVNQKDLLKAVQENVIAGAALDVLQQEPPNRNDAILYCPHILVTPHISYLSEEALYELKYRAADNAAKILAGEHTDDVITVLD